MKKIIIFCNFILSIFLLNASIVNGYGFGFVKSSDHQPPNIGFYETEISGTNSFYIGDKTKKELFLTFDAGYDNGVLKDILQTLKEKNVKATFFVTGDFIKREQQLLKQIVNEGHLVGNHTWSHKNITKLSFEQLKEEIKKVEDAFYEVTNEKMLKLFRPPEGEFDKQSLMNVKEIGYKTFFWSIAYRDWDTKKQHGSSYGYESIMNQLHNGAILLLHTVSTDNRDCLGSVIDDALAQGYVFKNLDEFPF